MRFIQHVNPSAGPADTDGHGGSTDIQCLIFRKRFCNVKKQASGTDLKFQIFSVFLKFGIAALIHFDQFYMIQMDPGIAFAFCSNLVAAVEIHAFHNGDVFSAVIQYTNRSFGLHQLHDRGFGGGFFGRLCGGSAGGEQQADSQHKTPDTFMFFLLSHLFRFLFAFYFTIFSEKL